MSNKWIPVEKELPKESGRYWCYLEDINDLGLSFFQWNCSYHEIEKRFSDTFLKNGERVTHWMPLAEPPNQSLPVEVSEEETEVLAEVPVGLNDLACAIFDRNVEKGFYEKPKNIGEMLCLIHSEVSEALEADRKNLYANVPMFESFNDWNRPKSDAFSFESNIKNTFEDEMADIIIRVLDLCAFKGIDIEKHLSLKMKYNSMREKYHGKKY